MDLREYSMIVLARMDDLIIQKDNKEIIRLLELWKDTIDDTIRKLRK